MVLPGNKLFHSSVTEPGVPFLCDPHASSAAAHSFYDVRPALFKSKGPVSLPDFCLAGCGRDCSCFIPAAYGYP